ncbi:MAG: MBL fold metallo-hydrolase, partial [Patescibacteria group bacterium]
MSAKITFHGGAGTVTGANFLIDTGAEKILVDCGILQREQVCDATNSAPFPYDVKTVDALIVTHAHADHIGRIPRLVRDGFRGAIHSTGATKDLAALMFGSYGVWSRLLGSSFGTFYQGWTRGLIIALILFPILYW